METHPGSSELELYVIGALPAPQAALLEAHVLSCEACAERLAREARLEMALAEVGSSLAEAPAVGMADLGAYRAQAEARRRPFARARRALASTHGRVGAATLAMAAAGLLLLPRMGTHTPEPPRPERLAQGPEAPAPQVAPVALQPERDGGQERWRAACPSHMTRSECRAEARRRGLIGISEAAAEDFPHYELTGRATVAKFSTAGWQR